MFLSSASLIPCLGQVRHAAGLTGAAPRPRKMARHKPLSSRHNEAGDGSLWLFLAAARNEFCEYLAEVEF
ncbi:hypothetical protein JTE90_003174 [Oedothorax gibbosus]|uniref:Uncharacterized protein n=1 Tax=Oedothorax gibbosus TaxID=931172 RepID=A0AAV6US18_9ARAC|nr:hypothetical protein JTE90_003174 [Oedothorax gibbosus]